ncbi:hypothetical protein KCU92_g10137, partial [Aureobasidium melanogenum]|jgi:hypothetical protein
MYIGPRRRLFRLSRPICQRLFGSAALQVTYGFNFTINGPELVDLDADAFDSLAAWTMYGDFAPILKRSDSCFESFEVPAITSENVQSEVEALRKVYATAGRLGLRDCQILVAQKIRHCQPKIPPTTILRFALTVFEEGPRASRELQQFRGYLLAQLVKHYDTIMEEQPRLLQKTLGSCEDLKQELNAARATSGSGSK